MDDLDLSSDWDLLKPKVDGSDSKPTNLQMMREHVERETINTVTLACGNIPGTTKEALDIVVERAVRSTLDEWHEYLEQRGTEGLLEFLLLGASLSALELEQLVHVLPDSLLNRVLLSPSKSTTGVHALISLEWHRRNGSGPHYRIDHQGQVLFDDPMHGTIGFYLDDRIKTDE